MLPQSGKRDLERDLQNGEIPVTRRYRSSQILKASFLGPRREGNNHTKWVLSGRVKKWREEYELFVGFKMN